MNSNDYLINCFNKILSKILLPTDAKDNCFLKKGVLKFSLKELQYVSV